MFEANCSKQMGQHKKINLLPKKCFCVCMIGVSMWTDKRRCAPGETFKCIIAALPERVERQQFSAGELHGDSPAHLQAVPEE